MFPTLENISETLGDIKVKHERRMSELESRMDSYETKNTEEIKSSVASMKEDVLVDIKSDVNKLVDQRNKELEDRKRREMNLVIFNLNENTHESGHVNKQRDDEDFRNITLPRQWSEIMNHHYLLTPARNIPGFCYLNIIWKNLSLKQSPTFSIYQPIKKYLLYSRQ